MRTISVVIVGIGSRNAFGRLVVADSGSGGLKLCTIHRYPLLDELSLGGGQLATDHGAGRDVELRFLITRLGVEMRGRMVIEEHADGDAVEEGYGQHDGSC